MITRTRAGITKPNPKYFSDEYVLSAEVTKRPDPIPTEPKTIRSALKEPGWYQAMVEELDALAKNSTWTLVRATITTDECGRV